MQILGILLAILGLGLLIYAQTLSVSYDRFREYISISKERQSNTDYKKHWESYAKPFKMKAILYVILTGLAITLLFLGIILILA